MWYLPTYADSPASLQLFFVLFCSYFSHILLIPQHQIRGIIPARELIPPSLCPFISVEHDTSSNRLEDWFDCKVTLSGQQMQTSEGGRGVEHGPQKALWSLLFIKGLNMTNYISCRWHEAEWNEVKVKWTLSSKLDATTACVFKRNWQQW